MKGFKIVNMHVVYGLLVDYTLDGRSGYRIFGDLSGNENDIMKLISQLGEHNDFSCDSLHDIIEDFVCLQGIPE